MNENENENINSTNDEEEVIEEEVESTEEEEVEEEEVEEEEVVEDKDKLIKTLKAQKEHWKKKATESNKSVESETKKDFPESKDLSSMDLYALMENKVPQEDVSEVKDYAALKKISIAEALKTPFVKSFLQTNIEERTTAMASNTKKSGRGVGKLTGDTLLEKATSKGELPESDEDMRKLAEARLGIK